MRTRTQTAGDLEEDPAVRRSRQRLADDLGLDEAAVEVVMNLRRQVIALQARVHELEATLEIYQAESGTRMHRYRQVTYEAVWNEAGDPPPSGPASGPVPGPRNG